MVKISESARVEAVLERLDQIERTLSRELGQVKDHLAQSRDGLEILSSGLRAYRDRRFKQQRFVSVMSQLRSIVTRDSELKAPHRKVLDVLIDNYDLEKDCFREIHFSKLVREARISKSRAKCYLQELEQQRYISRREDGYRQYWKLSISRE